MFCWGPPYTPDELDDAQARWNLRFPPDLMALFLERRPVFDEAHTIDWVKLPENLIQDRLDWPFNRFWFDVVNNDLWWPEWGERPAEREDIGTLRGRRGRIALSLIR